MRIDLIIELLLGRTTTQEYCRRSLALACGLSENGLRGMNLSWESSDDYIASAKCILTSRAKPGNNNTPRLPQQPRRPMQIVTCLHAVARRFQKVEDVTTRVS